jgi:two-component system, NtrC family, sensor kinase
MPMRRSMHIRQTMAFRLFLLIAGVQTVILAALAMATISVHQSHLRDHVQTSAARISDLMIRSTQHSMLRNDKDEVREIISAVGQEPGISGVRVFNKRGDVVFSTSAPDIKTRRRLQDEPCTLCHAAGSGLSAEGRQQRVTRTLVNPDGERVLALFTPIANAPSCANADCHAHSAQERVLGVMEVRMSLGNIDRSLAEGRNQLIALSIGAVLLVALISGGFIWWFVRRPVRALTDGMERASAGSLDLRLDVRSTDEIGQLARSYNRMMEDLTRAQSENREWSITLEAKIREKTDDLERAHRQMVNIEKMASLGNLAASVAHELNNPLEGILTFAKLSARRIQKLDLPADEKESVCNDLQLVAEEAQRCGSIVQNLLVFSRQRPVSFQTARLDHILDRCRLLVHHYARINHVDLDVDCTGDIAVECDPGQIQQVLIALMVNAIEAMSSPPASVPGGRLEVRADPPGDSGSVSIRLSDSGVGMTPEVKRHMFEPFYTTKSDGKGVGLGLAIAYGIVERHHGRIEVDTVPGQGSVFTVVLPVRQPLAPPPSAFSLEGNQS